jgi:hypothetical protein
MILAIIFVMSVFSIASNAIGIQSMHNDKDSRERFLIVSLSVSCAIVVGIIGYWFYMYKQGITTNGGNGSN